VITVNNGSAALKKIAELKPDLIVLDVYMPGYSGLEVCQRLKEAQETSRVPVLLTVGKLEPFKPEEAKRARADGFIVKPFEASELLSALSKLEDKIVPRPEASKPGRFARVSASIEEGRYDKTVAIEEDTGWKDRIGFPSKKKGKPAKEEEDESEIYNSMNKDLRTVVERKSTEKPHEAKAEETRVDLGALAPEGLPKDVTPEEIAALAAAAAQVQSKSAEAKIEAKTEDSRYAEPAPATAQTKQNEQAAELAQPVAEVPQPGTATPVPVATFADQKPEEKIEEKSVEQIEPKSAEKLDAPKEAASTAAPSTAEVIAAIAGLELDSVTSTSPGTAAENGSWASSSSSSAVGQSADEPVTMAMAAGAASGGGPSRWTAVSVALAPEESAISLEQEMQKAYAAFAAADAAHAGFDTAPPELQPAAPEPVVPVPATPAPEAAQSLSAVASVATEAVTEAAKELEAVATPYVEQETPAPEQFEPAVEKADASAEPTAEQTTDRNTQQSGEQTPMIAASETETAKLETAHQETSEPAHAEHPNHQSNDAAPAPEFASAPSAPEQAQAPESSPEVTSAAVVDEVPAEQIPAPASDVSEISASEATEAVPAKGEPRDESDIAATTAAAWASWRRIRESGTPRSHTEVEDSAAGSQDEAARAVAAGAEKTPQAPGDSEGIADIVDSVLADLRPKIYEEITRKMGKKK
jgi:CheY-like chemotaxis protein